MKILHLVSRIIVGVVFIFSGFVKGIDPLGTAYRLQDYFIAWDTPFMIPWALVLSILLSTMEFAVGVLILLNLKPRISAWILLLVMLFFTGLTFYDALYNPVPDCGCFGDAIKLTNWQTFYKNVFLMVPTIIIFLYRNRTVEWAGNRKSYLIGFGIAALFALFSYWNYYTLPVIDFMDWKKGNKMYVENPLPVKYYLTYKNKKTGETREYLSPNYPFNDSVWMNEWEFVEQRVEDPNATADNKLMIMDGFGNDNADAYIKNPDYQFILVSWNMLKADPVRLQEADRLHKALEQKGYSFITITSTIEENVKKLQDELGTSLRVFYSDDIVLKMMIRSNPGLILLKNGQVIEKWPGTFLPYADEVLKKYPLQQN